MSPTTVVCLGCLDSADGEGYCAACDRVTIHTHLRGIQASIQLATDGLKPNARREAVARVREDLPGHVPSRGGKSVELTYRQSVVLAFIRDFVASKGWPPTMREIGSATGIRSTNGVIDHLKALERKGFIRRDALTSRGLTLTEKVVGAGAPKDSPCAT